MSGAGTLQDWYDQAALGPESNLARLLNDKIVHVDRDEGPSFDLLIKDVVGVTAGIDSDGIFACVDVTAVDQAGVFSLYTNGNVSDEHDRTIGRHKIKGPKVVAPV